MPRTTEEARYRSRAGVSEVAPLQVRWTAGEGRRGAASCREPHAAAAARAALQRGQLPMVAE
jgi:hypothetical protein